MAGALNLDRTAGEMLELGLASCASDGVAIDPALGALSTRADKITFVAIARILLCKAPPLWLSLVVRDKHVHREYIPEHDLDDLQWIEPGLDQFLLSVGALTQSPEDDAFTKRLGDAAELFVFSALKLMGAAPIHVAMFSDVYGYDIECLGARTDRIEVKAASENTKGRFYLSRNEFDKSTLYGDEWRLIQVTFSNRAFIEDRIDSSYVESVRELNNGALREIIPHDTDGFRWAESALITVPAEGWKASELELDPQIVIDGFHKKNS